jgi:hypothetical protein
LELGNNNLNHADVVALASSLRRNTRVESLDLAGNNFGCKGAITLANAFRGDTTLKTINFSGIPIGDDGAVAIAQALTINATQSSLFVSNFNRGGWDDFASYLLLMNGLKSISFVGLELLRDSFSRQWLFNSTPEGSRAQYGARKRTLFSNTHLSK